MDPIGSRIRNGNSSQRLGHQSIHPLPLVRNLPTRLIRRGLPNNMTNQRLLRRIIRQISPQSTGRHNSPTAPTGEATNIIKRPEFYPLVLAQGPKPDNRVNYMGNKTGLCPGEIMENNHRTRPIRGINVKGTNRSYPLNLTAPLTTSGRNHRRVFRQICPHSKHSKGDGIELSVNPNHVNPVIMNT